MIGTYAYHVDVDDGRLAVLESGLKSIFAGLGLGKNCNQVHFHRVRAPALNSGRALKVVEFQKTEKVLVLEEEWKALEILKSLESVYLTVHTYHHHSCCKAGRRTAQTVLLINVMCMSASNWCVFSPVPVFYRVIDWKKGLELVLNY